MSMQAEVWGMLSGTDKIANSWQNLVKALSLIREVPH
jgi:hypothetical protein